MKMKNKNPAQSVVLHCGPRSRPAGLAREAARGTVMRCALDGALARSPVALWRVADSKV
jgi:hypothetical protein